MCFINSCPLKGERNKLLRDEARFIADCKILGLYKDLYKSFCDGVRRFGFLEFLPEPEECPQCGLKWEVASGSS